MQNTFTPADDDHKRYGKERLTLMPSTVRSGDVVVEAEDADTETSLRIANAQVPALALSALTHGGWGPGKVHQTRDGRLKAGAATAMPDEDAECLRIIGANYLLLAAHVEAANAAPLPDPDPAVERVAQAIHDARRIREHDSGLPSWDSEGGRAAAARDHARALAAAALAAVRESGAPAPEPEQPAPVAVGDRVVVVSPYLHDVAGQHGRVLSVNDWGTPQYPYLVRLDGDGLEVYATVCPLTAAEREADAAGENGARA